MKDLEWKNVKRLQELNSWLDFYKKNQRYSDIEKTQQQIKDHREKYKLTY